MDLLRDLLTRTVELGASDLHLRVQGVPVVRVDGELRRLDDFEPLSETDCEAIVQRVTERSPAKRQEFFDTGDLDTSFYQDGAGRFRVNGFRQRGTYAFAFRYVPKAVPTFDALGLPGGVRRLADEPRGLILVTGATGSGKSTTLAAMIDHINRTRRQHVVTIEDPIEIIHEDRLCVVNQREVGLDTPSFDEALRRVLRQDPDVILIGELRDEESARAALQAGESGHLVLSTMHTVDAGETVGRLIELFPSPKQHLVRQILAGVLRGVVSQRLLPALGGGRLAAVEVMVNTALVAELIRDAAKTEGIPKAVEQGAAHYMRSFSQHLVQLVLEGRVDPEVAANAASNRHDFELALAHAVRARQAAEAARRGPAVDVDDPIRAAAEDERGGLRLTAS